MNSNITTEELIKELAARGVSSGDILKTFNAELERMDEEKKKAEDAKRKAELKAIKVKKARDDFKKAFANYVIVLTDVDPSVANAIVNAIDPTLNEFEKGITSTAKNNISFSYSSPCGCSCKNKNEKPKKENTNSPMDWAESIIENFIRNW